MSVFEIVFWLSAFGLFYTFVGYPILIGLVALVRPRPTPKEDIIPRVSLIVSAHNEEAVIGQKIENCLALDYPREGLEIIVASDGSTDRTNEIVSQYANNGVTLLAIKEQQGKTLTLNEAVRIAKREIIVLTDANAMFARDALLKLVRNFSDSDVGFVTGWTQYKAEGASETGHSARSYGHLECLIKEKESLVGSCVGAEDRKSVV